MGKYHVLRQVCETFGNYEQSEGAPVEAKAQRSGRCFLPM